MPHKAFGCKAEAHEANPSKTKRFKKSDVAQRRSTLEMFKSAGTSMHKREGEARWGGGREQSGERGRGHIRDIRVA